MPEFNILEESGLEQVKKRSNVERDSTPETKKIAERLDFNFYDGDRKYGMGGYYYDGRWRKVAEVIRNRYGLTSKSKVLIDRCHKPFLVYDLKKLIPGITVFGIHPGKYPLIHAVEGYGRWALKEGLRMGIDPEILDKEARDALAGCLICGYAFELPFKDDYFDCVISIENPCSYPPEQARKIIQEIVRVSKSNGKNCYIQNDSWRNESQKQALMNWSFLCKTFKSVQEWEDLYREAGYEGDWGYTIIE